MALRWGFSAAFTAASRFCWIQPIQRPQPQMDTMDTSSQAMYCPLTSQKKPRLSSSRAYFFPLLGITA